MRGPWALLLAFLAFRQLAFLDALELLLRLVSRKARHVASGRIAEEACLSLAHRLLVGTSARHVRQPVPAQAPAWAQVPAPRAGRRRLVQPADLAGVGLRA